MQKKEGEPRLYVVLGLSLLVGLLSPVCTNSEQRQHLGSTHECSGGAEPPYASC